MRFVNRHIKYASRSDSFSLWFLTDLHLGSAACREDLLRQDIQRIRDDPFAYWIGGGDYVEAINPKDKRFDAQIVAPWVLEDLMTPTQLQARYAIDVLAPIASKCLALLEGNHEDTVRTWNGYSPYRDIVEGVGAAAGMNKQANDLALGVEGFVSLRFHRTAGKTINPTSWALPVYCHHGFGGDGVGLPGNYALKLGRVLDNNPGAMLALLGHLHVSHGIPKAGWYVGKDGRPHEVIRKAFYVQSYMEGQIDPKTDRLKSSELRIPVSTYSQKKGMAPKGVGCKPITVVPDKHEFWGVI